MDFNRFLFNDFKSCGLSLQSSSHLSFAVLVCYRIPIDIQLQEKLISHFGLQSQTTRLSEDFPPLPFFMYGAITLFGLSFQKCQKEFQLRQIPIAYNSKVSSTPDQNCELLPLLSPILRQSLLFSLPPLSNMFKFSGYFCLPQIMI